jgi:hypothetical protein
MAEHPKAAAHFRAHLFAQRNSPKAKAVIDQAKASYGAEPRSVSLEHWLYLHLIAAGIIDRHTP